MSFLNIQDISKNYSMAGEKVSVLRNNSLDMDSGKIHAVVGPSGCGKSTLLMICGGLIQPDSGKIMVGGEQLSGLRSAVCASRRAELVGFVFQRFHLMPYLNVEQNIMAACLARNVEDPRGRCDELIQRLGLSHRRLHIPSRLSAGEQQRVALGRALMNRPGLLVADEPTGNLDEESSNQLLSLFREFTTEGGLVILATHDRNVASFADRLYTYSDGRFQLSDK